MSKTSAQSKPRRWRRWLQFSLRSMLIVTTLAAVGTWWYLRPEPLERQLPDGMRLRAPVVVEENPQTGTTVSKNHGPFVVLDRHGRTLVKGFYDHDRPAGYWTYYHLDGRKVLAGPCIEGCRTGAWTVWDERGRKRAVVEHGRPVVAFVGKPVGLAGGAGGGLPKVAVREGPARQWWDNGRPRSEGGFQHDQGHGPWVFWNRDGVKVAAGELRGGVRHGAWMIAEEDGRKPREVQFVHGHQTPKMELLLADIEKQLQSDQWQVRHDAVTALGMLGPHGVPLLAKALKADDDELRLLALESLAKLGPDAVSAFADIEALTRHPDPATRFEGLLTLFRVAEDRRNESFKRLVPHVTASEANEQLLQVERLAELGSSLLPFLEETLKQDDANAKYLTLAVIAKMLEQSNFGQYQPDDPTLVNAACALLNSVREDSDPRVASAATFILNNPPTQPFGGMSAGFF